MMIQTHRTTVATLATAVFAMGSLAGCAPGVSPDLDGISDDESTSEQTEKPCIIGGWNLDVADYWSQSEQYLLGLGVPFEGFDMVGSGIIVFTSSGLVSTDIDLVTLGTLVARDTRVPIRKSSAYHGSGDWSARDEPDSIHLENWANLPTNGVRDESAGPDVPAIDYTDIDSVTAVCTKDTLILRAPGAPLEAKWRR